MSPLPPFRRTPWLSGVLLLVLAAGLVVPIVLSLGLRRWPLYLGLGAGFILLFGAIERLWQSRPLPRRHRAKGHGRFRVVPGGKGNGRTHDDEHDDEGDPRDGEGNEPRWLM